MLSGETAKGAWPVEAVTTMRQICNQAEKSFDSFRTVAKDLPPTTSTPWDGELPHLEAICQCSVRSLLETGPTRTKKWYEFRVLTLALAAL
jgi:pyruvate kinase